MIGNILISVSIALAETPSNKKTEVKIAMPARIALGILQIPDGNFLRHGTRVHSATTDRARTPKLARKEAIMRAF
jgi:hypothetical protein